MFGAQERGCLFWNDKKIVINFTFELAINFKHKIIEGLRQRGISIALDLERTGLQRQGGLKALERNREGLDLTGQG